MTYPNPRPPDPIFTGFPRFIALVAVAIAWLWVAGEAWTISPALATLVAGFGVGLAAGIAIGWALSHRKK